MQRFEAVPSLKLPGLAQLTKQLSPATLVQVCTHNVLKNARGLLLDCIPQTLETP
jgi:hypothetical protein